MASQICFSVSLGEYFAEFQTNFVTYAAGDAEKKLTIISKRF